jgi:hypothetical protein
MKNMRLEHLTRLLMRLGAIGIGLMGLIFLAAGVGGKNKLGELESYDLGIIGLTYLALTLGFWALADDPRRNIAIWRMLLVMQIADALYESYHLIWGVWPDWFFLGWLIADIWTLLILGIFGWVWYRGHMET